MLSQCYTEIPITRNLFERSESWNFPRMFHRGTGAIPASIGNLTNLQELYLRDNELQGAYRVVPVQQRSESHTSITRAGPLPKVMPPSLKTLQLGPDYVYHRNDNKFAGGIPAEWSSLTNLKELNLTKCGLDGASLRMFSSTQRSESGNFSRMFHWRTGAIPASIGNLTSLQYLNLRENKLSGACVCMITATRTRSITEYSRAPS